MRVQGGVEWDRNKFLKSNLHVYGKDDTQIMIYNMKREPRKEDGKKTPEGALGKNYWTLVILLVH